ncbi:MAG TPA: acetoacetate--CoA ligase [Solirubrobacterales bacterium]|nr:acetoacetate--CoA ligase [Solirubrobacterales bacterium]
MTTTTEPVPIWQPGAEEVERAEVTHFIRWLAAERGVELDGYRDLWRWSVDDLDGFWRAAWDYFEVLADGEPGAVLTSREMPGAEWFPGTRLNYAEHVFRGHADGELAILAASELRELERLTWGELRAEVARVAAGLRGLGVEEGDRVVAYMPNIAEAVVAFLATASLGAVWSSASPDFGADSVTDRFAQIEPKVLIGVDGYRYGGKDFERLDTVARLREQMPSVQHTVLVSYLGAEGELPDSVAWEELGARDGVAELSFNRVPFSAPLWVLYSSGTTGLPKAIVQSQGGILLEHLKSLRLHFDLRPGDRFFWFTTTGWMMWNIVVAGLLTEAPVVLFDGNPGYPDLGRLWDLAEEAGVTVFGTSAAFVSASIKAGVVPGEGRDLSSLRALGSTGSPLAPEGFDWLYQQLGERLWLFSTSGGSDVCSSFLGGVPTLPVWRGELQAPTLGAAVAAFDPDGEPVVGEVGELVLTEPLPSMPIYFWSDEDGSRYREAYFEMYPGVWRHGDWLEMTERGTAVIHGRSDSTINRGGIRIGTAEIYRALDTIPEVVDALVVDLPREGTDGWIALFVVLRDGAEPDEELTKRMARAVRERCSPRHVPDAAFAIAEVPRTLSGKVVEVPVKRILMGGDPEKVVSKGSLANPASLEVFSEFARRFAAE